MPQRWMLHALLLLALVLALGGLPPVTRAMSESSPAVADERAQPAPRPNFILVLTDDLDAETVGSLSRLRSLLTDQGTTFTNAFVNVALCCPSRATLLRGQYAHNTGVLTNHPPNGGFETFHRLGHEGSTVATWLRTAGYRTALLGKYLNGYPKGVDPSYVPPGWDEWRSPVAGSPYSEYDYQLNENGRIVTYGHRPEDYLGDVLAARANEFIRRAAAEGQPFFIYLPVYAPHGPATPAPRHENEFAGATAPRPPSFDEQDVGDKPEWLRSRRALDAEAVAQIDERYRERLRSMLAVEDLVEGLIRTLESTGQLANTYLIFSSDNGFHLGQHRQASGKQSPYEEDIKVPLIVRGPGVPAGRIVDHLVGNIDLAPTLADLAGAATPDFVDGRSLVPLLRAAAPPADGWRQTFLIEHGVNTRRADRRPPPADAALQGRPRSGTGGEAPATEAQASQRRPRRGAVRADGPRRRVELPEYQALRTPDHVYVEYVTGERELYDLRADPYQLESLHTSADPALVAQLAARLDVLRRCGGSTCRAADAGPP